MITPIGVGPELNEWLLPKAAWPIQGFTGIDEPWSREAAEAFADTLGASDLLFYRDVMSEQHYQLKGSYVPDEFIVWPVSDGPSFSIVEIDHDGDELDALLWLVEEAERLGREDRSAMMLVDLLMDHYRHEEVADAPRQTVWNYRRVIESFSRWLARPATVGDLTTTNLSGFIEHLLTETVVSRPAFQMHRVQIGQLSRYAHRKGWLQHS